MKKILLKSLSGFTLGVTLLVIAYASVYFISGENTFIIEIQQLQNIKTLITQVIVSGIAYYLLAILLNCYKEFNEKYARSKPYKFVFITIVTFILLVLIMFCVLGNANIYSKNIEMLNIIIVVCIYALTGLIFCIRNSIDKNLVNKFNQKLQEKNK
mgnify:FL=1